MLLEIQKNEKENDTQLIYINSVCEADSMYLSFVSWASLNAIVISFENLFFKIK